MFGLAGSFGENADDGLLDGRRDGRDGSLCVSNLLGVSVGSLTRNSTMQPFC
jgi:hypothetical protein